MANLALAPDQVIRTISPHDEMFVPGGEGHYFDVGRDAIECIGTALRAARLPAGQVRRILDFPCGHGRVLRHLKVKFPLAEITACDLQRDAVDYCAATLGGIPLYSREDPTEIPMQAGSFDLVWDGSLLTHLDGPLWGLFLNFFRTCLRPGGVMIFTTHGRKTRRRLVEKQYDYGLPHLSRIHLLHQHEMTGFGYVTYPNAEKYGVTLSDISWVSKEIAKVPELRVVHVSEAAWDNHHDVFACIRDSV